MCNVTVSVMALVRQSARSAGRPASNTVALRLDDHYDDAVMVRIYPNGIQADED